jgi:hypothetical protein
MKRCGLPEPVYDIVLEVDPDEDAEDRLLRVYELLLGLSGPSEIDLTESETTCYEPGAIRVCPCDAEEPQGQGVTR